MCLEADCGRLEVLEVLLCLYTVSRLRRKVTKSVVTGLFFP